MIRRLAIMYITVSWIALFLVGFFLLGSAVAFAHRPLPFGEIYADPQHALKIEDIHISQVIYYELTPQSPELWLTLDAKQGDQLYVGIGVPVIEELEDYRPSLVLLGPGMPDVDLPFEIPPGLGGVHVEAAKNDEPEVFHEHFTDTRSWVLLREYLSLPETGRYYLVAYSPSGLLAKLWVTVGRKEVYGMSDILGLPGVLREVREFHEEKGNPRWVNVASALVGVALLTGVAWWLKSS
jgi:hypothetical protein